MYPVSRKHNFQCLGFGRNKTIRQGCLPILGDRSGSAGVLEHSSAPKARSEARCSKCPENCEVSHLVYVASMPGSSMSGKAAEDRRRGCWLTLASSRTRLPGHYHSVTSVLLDVVR